MFSLGKGTLGGCVLAFCKYTRLYARRAEGWCELKGQVETVVAEVPLCWEAEAAPEHLPSTALGLRCSQGAA